MIIRTAHQSGRFDATADRKAAMLAQLTRTSSVAVVTEAKSIKDVPQGWAFTGHETKILAEIERWKTSSALAHTGTLVIPTPRWYSSGRGPARTRTFRAAR